MRPDLAHGLSVAVDRSVANSADMPRIRRDSRGVALVVTACVLFVIALGASTGAGVLVWLTPLYGQFRAWGRYVVVLDLEVRGRAGRVRFARDPLLRPRFLFNLRSRPPSSAVAASRAQRGSPS